MSPPRLLLSSPPRSPHRLSESATLKALHAQLVEDKSLLRQAHDPALVDVNVCDRVLRDKYQAASRRLLLEAQSAASPYESRAPSSLVDLAAPSSPSSPERPLPSSTDIMVKSARQRLSILTQRRASVLENVKMGTPPAEVHDELLQIDYQLEQARMDVAFMELRVVVCAEDRAAAWMLVALRLTDHAVAAPSVAALAGLDARHVFLQALDWHDYDAVQLAALVASLREVRPSEQAFMWLAVRVRETDAWFTEALQLNDAAELVKAFAKQLLPTVAPHLLPLWVPVLLFFSPRIVFWLVEQEPVLALQLVPRVHHQLVTAPASPQPRAPIVRVFPDGMPEAQFPDFAVTLSENAAQLEELKDLLVNGILDSLAAAADDGDAQQPPPPADDDDDADDYFTEHNWEAFVAGFVEELLATAMAGGALQELVRFDVFYELERRLRPDDAQVAHHHMLFTAVNEALAELYPALIPDALDEPWLDGVKVAVRRKRRPSHDSKAVARAVADWILRFDRLERVPVLDTGADARWRTGDAVIDRMKLVLCLEEREADAVPEAAQRQEAQVCAEVADELFASMLAHVAAQLEAIDAGGAKVAVVA